MTDALPIIRMVMYGGVALLAIRESRWSIWFTFTALAFSTYIYGFTGVSPIFVETIRTCVAILLVYVTVRRK